jgi:hypothetical protein
LDGLNIFSGISINQGLASVLPFPYFGQTLPELLGNCLRAVRRKPVPHPFNAASIFRSLDNGKFVRFGAYIDVQTWTSRTSNSFPVSIALRSPPVSISESHLCYTQKNETARDE